MVGVCQLWCPRYGPYNRVSREVFQWLRKHFEERLGRQCIIERASIDEAYVDVTEAADGLSTVS
eukprot:1302772-Amphidinium_carterae.2